VFYNLKKLIPVYFVTAVTIINNRSEQTGRSICSFGCSQYSLTSEQSQYSHGMTNFNMVEGSVIRLLLSAALLIIFTDKWHFSSCRFWSGEMFMIGWKNSKKWRNDDVDDAYSELWAIAACVEKMERINRLIWYNRETKTNGTTSEISIRPEKHS
jgi:hypothetical protein